MDKKNLEELYRENGHQRHVIVFCGGVIPVLGKISRASPVANPNIVDYVILKFVGDDILEIAHDDTWCLIDGLKPESVR